MSVIAYRDGVFAGDRQLNAGNTIGSMTKVFRSKKFLYGGVGRGTRVAALHEWIDAGMVRNAFPADPVHDDECGSIVMLVSNDGIFLLEDSPYLLRVENPIWAIGSGGELAMGAMAFGATAVEAVRIASELSADCGQGVDILTLNTTFEAKSQKVKP